MTTLAYIAQQNLIPTDKLERIVYSLCRLQAWFARDLVGATKTIIFTLPGQASTTPLLPLLHRAFPCERHIFVYDGLVDSAFRGYRLFTAESKITSWKSTNSHQDVVRTNMPQSVTASIPISPLINQTTVSQSLYALSLSKLPTSLAGIIEAWMSSVDTFLTLKTPQQPMTLSREKDLQLTEIRKIEEYLPFVCRLGLLLGQVGRLGNGDKDLCELACINVLQYMTGSRSRPLSDAIISKAFSALHELQQDVYTMERAYATKISQFKKTYSVAIEQCVFTHKNILIENKTLIDTVQPMKEWTLVAAKKVSGCSCCLPTGEDDEDEARPLLNGNEYTTPKNTSIAIPFNSQSNYVDGKTGFAFDPTRFNIS